MNRNDRMGRRIELDDPCRVQYSTLDGEKRDHQVTSLNLSTNALATRVERDSSIVEDYHELINGPAYLRHSSWVQDPDLENWRRGFLCMAQRINSREWKWVFFFNRKYPLPDEEDFR